VAANLASFEHPKWSSLRGSNSRPDPDSSDHRSESDTFLSI
jgi:hypothetical protein